MLSNSSVYSTIISTLAAVIILAIFGFTFRSRGFFDELRLQVTSSLNALVAGLASALLWVTSAHLADDKYANASAAVFAAATALFTSTSARLLKWDENSWDGADKWRMALLACLGALLAALAVAMLFTGI